MIDTEKAGPRGVQEADVKAAADALWEEGERPTVRGVRKRLGTGSPNTIGPMLDRYYRAMHESSKGKSPVDEEMRTLPLSVAKAAQTFWHAAAGEAKRAAAQQSEADRRTLELDRAAHNIQVKDFEHRQAEAAATAAGKDIEIAEVRAQLARALAQTEELKAEVANVKGTAKTERDSLTRQLAELHAVKDGLVSTHAAALQQRDRELAKIEDLRVADSARLNAEVDRARREAKHFGDLLATERDKRAGAETTLRERHAAEVQKVLTSAAGEKTALQAQLAERSAALAEATGELKARQARIEELQASRVALAGALAALQRLAPGEGGHATAAAKTPVRRSRKS